MKYGTFQFLMKDGCQSAILKVGTPNFELDRALMLFNMTTKSETKLLKTKDCRALTRQSKKFHEKWPPGGRFASKNPQIRT